MESVTIADLKSNLSKYLRRVRSGEEILVCDRSVPIGKIVPLVLQENLDAEEMELVAAGVLRLPEIDDKAPRRTGRGGRISSASILKALDTDRND